MLDRAYHYFIYSWFGRNGTAGTDLKRVGKSFALRFTKNGGHAATRLCSAVDSIPAWRRRLRDVTVLRKDGFELLERTEDSPGTAIYCDPPYVDKGADYQHDFVPEDHERLAGILKRFKKTRVVVSYYEHPTVRELYRDWTVRSIEVSKAMAHQGSRGRNDKRAVELLIINGPSLGESKGLF